MIVQNGFRDLSIVIPVYNEKDNIQKALDAILSCMGSEPEILICYDFEEDNTLPAARSYLSTFSSMKFVKNRGKGVLGALKTGFEEASRPAVLVSMADLSDDLSSVAPMLQAFQKGAVVVCASRYMRGGSQIGGPWIKRTFSRLAGVSLHYLLGIPTHDITNNFRLYSRDFLRSITVESRGGFELAMELTVKAFVSGFSVAEVPTVWHDRTTGTSRFQLMKWLPHYLRWYIYALQSPKVKIK